MSSSASTTIDEEEVSKFSERSDQWWDATGAFKTLHDITPLRIGYIREQVETHMDKPLSSLSVLDVGCGGGLACEPIARLGASVTGIDASERNIGTARYHAEQSGLAIDYQATTAEMHAQQNHRYDVVLALEIIEHVSDVALFLESLAQLVKPGGILCITTLNRTFKSLALAKIAAEYVLRWVPTGTHDWNKFLKPSEIAQPMERYGFQLRNVSGMVYHPLSRQWSLSSDDVSINYLLSMQKKQ